jgi:hypothetical protein
VCDSTQVWCGVRHAAARPARPTRARTTSRELVWSDFWGEKHLCDFALDPTGTVDYDDPTDPDVIAMWVEMQVLAKWPTAGPANDVGPCSGYRAASIVNGADAAGEPYPSFRR